MTSKKEEEKRKMTKKNKKIEDDLKKNGIQTNQPKTTYWL